MALMKLVILAVVVAVALAHGHHKGGRDKPCEKPTNSSKGYALLDDASKAKVDAIWLNYVNGTNCTEQRAATKQIFETFFSAKILAETDAKAANLSAAAQAVYNQQIRPLMTNTTIEGKEKWDAIIKVVKAQTPEIQAELKQLKPNKHGKHGKRGRGGKSKSSEETSTPVPSS